MRRHWRAGLPAVPDWPSGRPVIRKFKAGLALPCATASCCSFNTATPGCHAMPEACSRCVSCCSWRLLCCCRVENGAQQVDIYGKWRKNETKEDKANEKSMVSKKAFIWLSPGSGPKRTSWKKLLANICSLRLCLVLKFLSPNFTIYLSHQIFCLMHGALNVVK